MLTGTEVKSLRAGRASLVDGFASIDDGEVWLQQRAHPRVHAGHLDQPRAAPQAQAAAAPQEIDKLIGKTKEGGLTLVPLVLYFKDGKAKVEIALARARSLRQAADLAEKQASREMARAHVTVRSRGGQIRPWR